MALIALIAAAEAMVFPRPGSQNGPRRGGGGC